VNCPRFKWVSTLGDFYPALHSHSFATTPSLNYITRPIFNSESDPPPLTVQWHGPFGLSILLPQAHLHPNIDQSSRWSLCPGQDFRSLPRVNCVSFARWFVCHSARCRPLLYFAHCYHSYLLPDLGTRKSMRPLSSFPSNSITLVCIHRHTGFKL
jgi:hypothetical protein